MSANPISIKANGTMDLEERAKFFTKLGTHLFICTAKEIRDISFNTSSAEGLSGQSSEAIEITINASGASIGAVVGSAIPGPAGMMAGAKGGKMAAGVLNKIAQYGISGGLKVSCQFTMNKYDGFPY